MNLIHFIFDIYVQAGNQKVDLMQQLNGRHTRPSQLAKTKLRLARYEAIAEQSYYIFRSLEVIKETSEKALKNTFYDDYFDELGPLPDPHELIFSLLTCDEIVNITRLSPELREYIECYPSVCLEEKMRDPSEYPTRHDPHAQYLTDLENSFIVHSYEVLTDRIRQIAQERGDLNEIVYIIEHGQCY
ncbi:hypothetical protein SAMN05421823_110239 [Catalinimonas alkaloidigena]|uniref:Uncharacterized protein n=1 Tax=Catalinimonas alkaloidigena TaxID=1075417 RepID=A0A1G9QNV6_9BACT|nr:hypothetical protein [Catalinimonas alkaloidigena]SDM12521.1 hypothetical protein SAMN05421823_110239 [Catalinimonas alkaloidigena]